jgi:hypothetical protein
MHRVFAILLAAGCVRQGLDVRVIEVRGPAELPTIEPLATDPRPTPADDAFIELTRPG